MLTGTLVPPLAATQKVVSACIAGVVNVAPVYSTVPLLLELYQVKGAVPDAVSVVVLPGHTTVLPVMAATGVTVTTAIALLEHPVEVDVPVTCQFEVAEGVKVMLAPL